MLEPQQPPPPQPVAGAVPPTLQQPPVFIENPPCPYSGEIPGGLQNGTMITVQGKTPMNQNSFSINLCTSGRVDPMSDTCLHLNPRFNDKALILNSLISDSWGSEQRSSSLPLKKGQPFEIIILTQSNEFKIALNGRHFTQFGHRMPKEKARFLVIKGGIEMNFIRITGSYVPPPQPPTYNEHPVIYNPPNPVNMEIPGEIYPQRIIQISGFPKAFNPSRFTVNLKAGSEIALHFDVRFSFGDSRNVVIRNSYLNGGWGAEEDNQPGFPFRPGVSFDLMILVEAYCFMVAVNNQHFAAFNHRLMPLSRINTFEVTGDVQLNMIRF